MKKEKRNKNRATSRKKQPLAVKIQPGMSIALKSKKDKEVRVMEEDVRTDFVHTILNFARAHKLTANNILEAAAGAVEYMIKNAVIKKEDL